MQGRCGEYLRLAESCGKRRLGWRAGRKAENGQNTDRRPNRSQKATAETVAAKRRTLQHPYVSAVRCQDWSNRGLECNAIARSKQVGMPAASEKTHAQTFQPAWVRPTSARMVISPICTGHMDRGVSVLARCGTGDARGCKCDRSAPKKGFCGCETLVIRTAYSISDVHTCMGAELGGSRKASRCALAVAYLPVRMACWHATKSEALLRPGCAASRIRNSADGRRTASQRAPIPRFQATDCLVGYDLIGFDSGGAERWDEPKKVVGSMVAPG
jgi:hypothetical protein